MQYSIVAVLALAGSVIASPAQITVTTSTTSLVTITTCAPAITDCPAAKYPVTITQTIPLTYSYSAVPKASGGLYPSGMNGNNCPAGAACAYATGNSGYKFPSPSATSTGSASASSSCSGSGCKSTATTTTAAYKGPIYSGAADSVKAMGALAGVGAVAALLL